MTGQIPDQFILDNQSFSLVGLKGQGLFKPVDFGINPYSSCTACWRGYVNKYRLTNNHLILYEMLVNVDNPAKIKGIEPQTGDELFKYHYKEMNLKCRFTGNLLLAKDFIQSMYVHMGFQRPMAYKTIIEIQMKDGEIISERDLSKEMEEKRIFNENEGVSPRSDSQNDIENWVNKTFSLDYDF